jgi:hypothetical protein
LQNSHFGVRWHDTALQLHDMSCAVAWCRWGMFLLNETRRGKRNTARHVAQQQSGIMLPHSKEWVPLTLKLFCWLHPIFTNMLHPLLLSEKGRVMMKTVFRFREGDPPGAYRFRRGCVMET